MKKLFLASAIALSMAVSTTAFAEVDVTYGNNNPLGLSYDAANNTVSIDRNLLASEDGQVTILIADVDNNIAASDILYIDQTAAAADIFQNMGLLLADNAETLPVGTYYVKIGGDNMQNILTGTIVVAEQQNQGTTVTFVFGDVTGDDAANADDAAAIMFKLIGGDADVGGEYAISEEVNLQNGESFIFGDVTGDDAANADDAAAIMFKLIGGDADVGGDFAIGAEATYTVAAVAE